LIFLKFEHVDGVVSMGIDKDIELRVSISGESLKELGHSKPTDTEMCNNCKKQDHKECKCAGVSILHGTKARLLDTPMVTQKSVGNKKLPEETYWE
ncbi:hypothetical protein GWI33_010703, partial [Rhynchophorus ferrugineus]